MYGNLRKLFFVITQIRLVVNSAPVWLNLQLECYVLAQNLSRAMSSIGTV